MGTPETPPELQNIVNDELARRQAAGGTIAEQLRGFDDFCRRTTARWLAANPASAAQWIALRTASLAQALAAATTMHDYEALLRSLSATSPLGGVTSECPQYALVPPTFIPPSDWPRVVAPAITAPDVAERLVAGGFIPVAVEDVALALGEPLAGETTLIDGDYGIALLPRGSRARNAALDSAMLRRYTAAGHAFHEPSDVFDVGLVRGEQCYRGRVSDAPELVSLPVGSRDELERIIARLRSALSQRPRFELWFRGQPREHLLADLRPEANLGVCGWRSLRDISLVPSLYRDTAGRLTDLASYCRRLVELHQYYLFMKETLGLPSHDTRGPNEPVRELFDRWWGQERLETTSTMTIEGELVEHHDTHRGFRGLQAALFLQHYGLESNVLDVTDDIDVALFFAQNALSRHGVTTPDYGPLGPVVYAFIVDRELDPVVNTSELLQDYDVPRPKRQHCGIIAGASLISRNYYARFISLRIRLMQPITTPSTAAHLFPDPQEDPFLANLLTLQRTLSPTLVAPFVIGP